MMMILASAAMAFAGSAPGADPHHAFRLPPEAPPVEAVRTLHHQRSRSRAGCTPSGAVTVCANRADEQSRWRISAEDDDTAARPGQHLRALRVQHSRCANPVEDALRCVKPLPLARMGQPGGAITLPVPAPR
ncbi:MAG: hypothetical protein ACK4Z7_08910 [Novosphingobium sp.]